MATSLGVGAGTASAEPTLTKERIPASVVTGWMLAAAVAAALGAVCGGTFLLQRRRTA
ncbi:MAG: hypothetical protein ACOYNI_02485 [Acidimicrobiia bacterium]